MGHKTNLFSSVTLSKSTVLCLFIVKVTDIVT